MKTRFVLATVVAALLLLGAGCGDVCDDATELCSIEVSDSSQCEGEDECRAICIVDNDTCACDDTDLKDPLCTCLAKCG